MNGEEYERRFWQQLGTTWEEYEGFHSAPHGWVLPRSGRRVWFYTGHWKRALPHVGFPDTWGISMVTTQMVAACLDQATDGQLAALVMEGLVEVEECCDK